MSGSAEFELCRCDVCQAEVEVTRARAACPTCRGGKLYPLQFLDPPSVRAARAVDLLKYLVRKLDYRDDHRREDVFVKDVVPVSFLETASKFLEGNI